MPRCAIGLGGNLGDVAAAFATALRRLEQSNCALVAVSRRYVTQAVGPQAGTQFQNACALIDTALTPHELLDLVQQIERDAGRTPTVRWGARPIDIDLLTYGERVLREPRLTIPHPGMVYRRFVLDPLVEIAPELVHPVLHRTIDELQRRLLERPMRIVLRDGTESQRIGVEFRLVERFGGMIQLDTGFAFAPGCIRTIIDLAPECSSPRQRPPGTVVVELDPQLLRNDQIEAAVAVVTAMLDEPTPAGDIRLPDF